MFLRAGEESEDSNWDERRLVGKIHDYCREKFGSSKPQLPFVFTHTKHDRHRQHVMTNVVANQAFRLPILCFPVSSSSDDNFAPVIGIDISDWISKKEEAFAHHASQQQLKFADGTLASEAIRVEASELSTEMGFQYGELFECELPNRIAFDQIVPLIPICNSTFHFRKLQKQLVRSKSGSVRSEWLSKLVQLREQGTSTESAEIGQEQQRITLNQSSKDALRSKLFPHFFNITAIDGCIEILATPDDHSRYSGYLREQVHCDFVSHQWLPESEDARQIMLKNLRKWQNQRSHP